MKGLSYVWEPDDSVFLDGGHCAVQGISQDRQDLMSKREDSITAKKLTWQATGRSLDKDPH